MFLTVATTHRATLCAGFVLAFGLAAIGADPSKPDTAKQDENTDAFGTRWFLSTSGALERGSLPINRGNAIYLTVDGRSYSFNSTPTRTTGSSSGAKSQSQPEKDDDEDTPAELKADSRVNFKFPPDLHFEWTRYARRNKERGCVRFIDVMTNTGTQSRSLRLRYENEVEVPNSDYFQGATTERGEIINSDDRQIPAEAAGVMLHFDQSFCASRPFWIIGRPREPWTGQRRLDGYNVRQDYNGSLEAGKRVIFIHWIGARGAKEKGKPEKAVERVIAGDKLLDADIPEEWRADVVNFPPESFRPPQTTEPNGDVKLVLLDLLCQRLGVSRDAKDHLALDRDTRIDGNFKTAAAKILRGGFAVPVLPAQLAAVSGGAGKGREHRLYLRDGSVLAGRVTLDGARFSGAGVGEVSVDVDSLDHIILRRDDAADGKVAKAAGLLLTARGEMLCLASLPGAPLSLRTASGALALPWGDISAIRERTTLDPGFVVTLKDGSRASGLPDFHDVTFKLTTGEQWQSAAELSGCVTSLDDAEKLTSQEKSDDAKPGGGWCETTQGSVWAGHLAKGEVRFEAAAGMTSVKTDEIKAVRRASSSNAPGASAMYEIELSAGQKLRGRFVTAPVRWQRGDQVIEMPWSQVVEIGMEERK